MSVQPQSVFTSTKLFIRTLLPSAASLSVSLLLALAIVGGHVLLVTLNGDAQPNTFNSQALSTYNSTIIDPLLRLTNSTALNNGLGVVMWGVFGWILYEATTLIVTSVSDWRSAKNQVRIAGGTVVHSPMQRTLFVRFAWRLGVVVCLSAFTIAMLPVMHYCLANDYHVLMSSTLADTLPYILRTIGTWILMFHGYLILLRLYMMRTRVFGEIIY